MNSPSFLGALSLSRPLPILLVALGLCAAGVVVAQIEQGDRGVAPIDSSSSYEVTGVTVDVAAKTADVARTGGWREAQRKGWKMLWARVNGESVKNAPGLPDSTLDSIVSGIVVEDEQIGPQRYIARLGVLFDRARAGQLLGVQGQIVRSPPMLVIPIMYTGGTPTSLELKNEWQKAWARYRSGGSPVDYVRPTGTGVDPLLLNAAQTRRPGRGWWRLLLDSYGAADIVVPEVYLERAWPGGPVNARFVARHGPDGRVVGSFSLHIDDGDGLPAMMDEGVRRIDELYTAELRMGGLMPDPSLVIEEPVTEGDNMSASDDGTTVIESLSPTATTVSYSIQVDTPDAAAVSAAEGSLRGVPGVRSAGASSLALGGLSIFRIAFEGDLAALRLALQARGWRVDEGGGTLRIRRAPPSASPVPAPAPAAPATAP